jgi:hypothetical protein
MLRGDDPVSYEEPTPDHHGTDQKSAATNIDVSTASEMQMTRECVKACRWHHRKSPAERNPNGRQKLPARQGQQQVPDGHPLQCSRNISELQRPSNRPSRSGRKLSTQEGRGDAPINPRQHRQPRRASCQHGKPPPLAASTTSQVCVERRKMGMYSQERCPG